MKYTLIALLLIVGCKKESNKINVLLNSSGYSQEVFSNGNNSDCEFNRTKSYEYEKGDTFKLKLQSCNFKPDLRITVKINGVIKYDGSASKHTVIIPL